MIEKAYVLINEDIEKYGWVFVKEANYVEEILAIEVNEYIAWQRGTKPEPVLKKDLIEISLEKYNEWEEANLNEDIISVEKIINEIIDAYKVGEVLK